MKILQINKFFYLKGGPERCMFNISDVLERKGHEVAFFSMKHPANKGSVWGKYYVDNIDYNKDHGYAEKCKLFFKTLYSKEARNKLSKLIEVFKPDIAHIHNFNHQLTPSILFALKKGHIPIVMTVHDYKLVCPSYSMRNDGQICELCEDGKYYNCFFERCHKGSLSKSLLAMTESYLHHNVLKSYESINTYICPSDFIRNKLKSMGLKGDFVLLPNSVNCNNCAVGDKELSTTVTYLGRLSSEKGVCTLIEAAKGLQTKVNILGDGPIRGEIEDLIQARNINNVNMLGYLTGDSLRDKILDSMATVLPSECYENNPLAVLESYALERPVIGSRIGGIPELIEDGVTGLLFEPGNVDDLREKINYMVTHPEKVKEMGQKARKMVEEKFNLEIHYEKLMGIYRKAIKDEINQESE